MSQPRMVTPIAGAAAALPLTGGSTLGFVLMGSGALATGLLLLRAARRRTPDNKE